MQNLLAMIENLLALPQLGSTAGETPASSTHSGGYGLI